MAAVVGEAEVGNVEMSKGQKHGGAEGVAGKLKAETGVVCRLEWIDWSLDDSR